MNINRDRLEMYISRIEQDVVIEMNVDTDIYRVRDKYVYR